MDDLARDLGISKKTIYQYFPNKAAMLKLVAAAFIEEEKEQSERLTSESSNAIDENIRILNWSVQTFDNIAPNVMKEVEKYYPEVWQLFQTFLLSYIVAKTKKNLEWGIEEGLYRKGLNLELTSRIRVTQVINSMDQDYFPNEGFNQGEVQKVALDLYLYSIMTPKGKELYNQRINHTETN